MKYIIILSILLIGFILSSCEEIIENPNLPYEERLVVYGILIPNEQIRIFVTKTNPPLTQNPIFPPLDDAIVTLQSDGETYTLYPEVASNIFDGKFFTTNLLPIQEGKQYHLKVNWRGKTVTSTTFVPPKPIVTSMWKSDTVLFSGPNGQEGRYNLNFSTPSVSNTMVTGLTYYSGDTSYSILETIDFSESYNFLDYFRYEDSTIITYEESLSPFPGENDYIRLLAIDQAFHLYITTNDRRNNNDGIFGGGGGNPIWNVTGDGFGLFLGVNEGYAIRP